VQLTKKTIFFKRNYQEKIRKDYMASALDIPSKYLVFSFPASSSPLVFFVTKISTLPAKVGEKKRNLS